MKRLLSAILFIAASAYGQTASVSWSTLHQTIDGFGASDWHSAESISAPQATLFFDPVNGIGLSFVRTLGNEECNNTISDFSTLQQAVALGAKVWLTMMTPPIAMKDSGVCQSGNLLAGSYQAYANYIVQWIQNLQAGGVPVYGVSPINEPDLANPANPNYVPNNIGGYYLSPSQLDTFIKGNLGPALASAGLSTKIIIAEDGQWFPSGSPYDNEASVCLADMACAAYVSVLGAHGYGYGPYGSVGYFSFGGCCSVVTVAPESTSTGQLWQTEINGASGSTYDGSIANGLVFAQNINDYLVTASATSWQYWMMIGPSFANDNEGLTDNSGNPAKRLYTLGNFAKFIRPCWSRIDTTTNPQSGVYVTAYKDCTSSGKFAIVTLNQNSGTTSQPFALSGGFPFTSTVTPWVTDLDNNLAQQSGVSVSSNAFTYPLLPQSVTTFVGTAGGGGPGPAANVYIAATAMGSNNGANCANAYAYGFFNSAGNWGTGITQIGPGTIVHPCGTIPCATDLSTMLATQGPGASGNPVTILFDSPGATLTCPSMGIGILVQNPYIVVDGHNLNGTIQNTANGATLAHQDGGANGIRVSGCTSCVIKGMNVVNLYVPVYNSSGNVISGSFPAGIYDDGSNTNLLVTGNNLHDEYIGVAPGCGGGGSGTTVSNNTIYHTNWGVGGNPNANATIIGNDISDAYVWDEATNANHHNGIYTFTEGCQNSMSGLTIAANFVHGDFGIAHTTGWIFTSCGMVQAGQPETDNIPDPYIYNNVLVAYLNGSGEAASSPDDAFLTIQAHHAHILNNTVLGMATNLMQGNSGISVNSCLYFPNGGWDVQNNVVSTVNAALGTDVGGTMLSNRNVFYNLNGGASGNQFAYGPCCQVNLAAWQSASSQDANSITTNPLLTASYTLGSGSPAIALGANLTSYGIAALDMGAPATFGTGYACGAGCGPRPPPATAWDASAYESGATVPALTFSPTSLAFGNQAVGTTSAAQTIQVTNSGGATMTISSIVMASTGMAAGTNFAETTTCGGTLAAGASCNVSVKFAPTTTGPLADSVVVTDNASGSPHSASVGGTGVNAPSVFQVNYSDCGEGPFGAATSCTMPAATQGVANIVILNSNNGFSGSVITGITDDAPAGSNSYAQVSGARAVNATPGTFTDIWWGLNANAGATHLFITVSPAITGIVGIAQVSGVNAVDQSCATNSGSTSMSPAACSVTTTHAAEYIASTIDPQGTCTGLFGGNAFTLNSLNYGNCLAYYLPTTTGTYNFQATASGGTFNASTASFYKAATGVPVASLSATSLAFGNQTVTVPSGAQTVTLTNTGTANLVVSSVALTTGTQYAIASNNCVVTLAPNAACEVGITFTPLTTGAKADTLTFTDNASPTTQTVSLSGTGVAQPSPSVSLSPTSVNFGFALLNPATVTQVVTLTNSGNANLTVSAVAVTLDSTDFSVANTCVSGSPIAPSATCTITITFSPMTVGSKTGTVQVTDNAAGSPQSIPLMGTGVSFTTQPSPNGATVIAH